MDLTSDRKVCADFCAPTCSRYSYTYNANLKCERNKLLEAKLVLISQDHSNNKNTNVPKTNLQ